MIIPDVNVLLYATVDAFPGHERAYRWWSDLLSSREEVGIATVCVMGFLRIATHRRILVNPLAVSSATAIVDSWLSQPNVHVLASDRAHLEASMKLLAATGTAGNLTTDAQIAAHALACEATVATNDTDFGRFPGVRTMNPTAG